MRNSISGGLPLRFGSDIPSVRSLQEEFQRDHRRVLENTPLKPQKFCKQLRLFSHSAHYDCSSLTESFDWFA